MALDWKEVTLSDVVSKLGDGLHGTPKYDELGEYPFINGNNLLNGKIVIKESTQCTNEEEYNKYKKELNERTILVSINGTLGNIALYNNEKCILGKSACYFNVIPEVDRLFIKYVVTDKTFQDYIRIFAHGTTIQNVSLKTMREYPFLLPSPNEQRAIVDVLSSLDDKIDLLNRQNATLESLAETLFRQWFVEEAREEWEEMSLSSIAVFLNGLACQKFPPQNEVDKLPVLKIKDLRNGFSDDNDWATTEVKPEYIVENGDVIFAWSASLMVKIWDGAKCILNQHLFKVTSEVYPKWFYYYWCKIHLQNFISISESHATTMGHIKRGDLDEALVVVPTPAELAEIDAAFAPTLEKIIANNRQISSLSTLRDTLLPKLMSGEVRVNFTNGKA